MRELTLEQIRGALALLRANPKLVEVSFPFHDGGWYYDEYDGRLKPSFGQVIMDRDELERLEREAISRSPTA